MKRMCAFCGASLGKSSQWENDGILFAQTLLKNNVDLVYGGGSLGIMGAISKKMIEGGGRVYGVIPRFLQDKEVLQEKCTELKIVETMHERKQLMYDLSSSFAIFAGGYGTLDEFFEILTWSQLLLHQKPIYLLNINGFYRHLIKHIEYLYKEGFINQKSRDLINIVDDFSKIEVF